MCNDILAKSSMVQRRLNKQFTTKCAYLVERDLFYCVMVVGNIFEKNKIFRK